MANKDESYKDMFLQVRQAILMIVDAIERHYDMKPTAELRKENKYTLPKKKKSSGIEGKIEASYRQRDARPDDPDKER